jgi:sulfofructose kinase
MLDVLGVGTNSVDEVLQLPAEIGAALASGKARVTARRFLCGGQTATVVAACAALGMRAGYVGAFGRDEHGKLIRGTLHSAGVDLSGAIECDAPNRGAVIIVDAIGNRTVLWHRSEELRMPIDKPASAALCARIVHVDDDDPALALRAAKAARAAGIPVTSDLEHPTDQAETLIASVTYPILEQNLARGISGEPDPERAVRKLRRLNGGLLVVTLGDRGSVALDGDTFYSAPAFRVNVVDSTGAGDVFRAGFIYGLIRKWSVADMLRFANAAAGLSCTKLGAIPSVPTLAEVERLLASHAGVTRSC